MLERQNSGIALTPKASLGVHLVILIHISVQLTTSFFIYGSSCSVFYFMALYAGAFYITIGSDAFVDLFALFREMVVNEDNNCNVRPHSKAGDQMG